MKKVKVGGIQYFIKFSNDPRTVSQDRDDACLLDGCVNYDKRMVGILSTQTKTALEQTFLHELTHIIIRQYHVENMVEDDGKHSEKNIDLLAMGLQEALTSLGINLSKVIKDGKS